MEQIGDGSVWITNGNKIDVYFAQVPTFLFVHLRSYRIFYFLYYQKYRFSLHNEGMITCMAWCPDLDVSDASSSLKESYGTMWVADTSGVLSIWNLKVCFI